jgi:hypothetical protein
MPEALTEKNWNAIKKAIDVELDDDALVKALRKFEKTDAAKPVAWKSALGEVTTQVTALQAVVARQRKALGTKAGPIQAKLTALSESAADLLKSGPATAGGKDDKDDEDEDAPALLSSKMKPLLRELMQGDVTMHALICTVGKSTVALVMRKEIGPQRRAFVASCAAEKGTPKYIPATCSLERGAITFVVQEGGKGLARRVSQALKDQTDTKWKVRVRGPDGDDEDEEDGTGPGAPEAAAAAPPQEAADDPQARIRAWHDELRGSVDALAEPGDPDSAADLAKLKRGLAYLEKPPATPDMAKVEVLVDTLRDVVAAIRDRIAEAARMAEAARRAEEARLA